MKKTLDIKKLILLNMPYILLGLFATNFGEAWRMAQGAEGKAGDDFCCSLSESGGRCRPCGADGRWKNQRGDACGMQLFNKM